VQAAAPIFVSAVLMLMLTLLLILGLVLTLRTASPQAALVPSGPMPFLTSPEPTRHSLAAKIRARLHLRAPPTVPDQFSELCPAECRMGSFFAALAPPLVVS